MAFAKGGIKGDFKFISAYTAIVNNKYKLIFCRGLIYQAHFSGRNKLRLFNGSSITIEIVSMNTVSVSFCAVSLDFFLR
jgi:hypothetical protein